MLGFVVLKKVIFNCHQVQNIYIIITLNSGTLKGPEFNVPPSFELSQCHTFFFINVWSVLLFFQIYDSTFLLILRQQIQKVTYTGAFICGMLKCKSY